MIDLLLLLDIGNTTIRYRLYQDAIQKGQGTIKALSNWGSEEQKKFYNVSRIFYSDVRGGAAEEVRKIFPSIELISMETSQLSLPYAVAYETPETLGADRKALAAAAFYLFPNTACLIIDAGSCITYDFIDAKGVYHGGAISPGIAMRYIALHQQTGRLPALKPHPPKGLIGHSTAASIHTGIHEGVLGEITHQITSYLEKHPNLQVVLTGGDGEWLSKSIKKPIFAEPNFLFDGMHALWQFNKNS